MPEVVTKAQKVLREGMESDDQGDYEVALREYVDAWNVLGAKGLFGIGLSAF